MNVIPRDSNKKPFLLLDGHQSWLEIPLFEYINTPEDHWVVFPGVPYWTAQWQVGNSKEQNGSFNIAFTKAKQELLNLKIKKMAKDTSLQPTDLMPPIVIAWKKSFARVDKNQQVIAERGLNPLNNKNILTNPELGAAMTKREMCDESSKITLPPPMRSKQAITTPSSNNNEMRMY